MAEFERDLIRERTMTGLVAAKLKGRTGGKPKDLNEDARKQARFSINITYSFHEPTSP
ncbi:hypothetical protein GCM10023187_45930 [Nibrella viscosa]|uniref:Resolvase/invertase-type recombinase catalytic domain-containing protein n=1 Tax=Nibrella viscosa TaxID=1084524 RepID=A0ABP8KUJ2_9BACT